MCFLKKDVDMKSEGRNIYLHVARLLAFLTVTTGHEPCAPHAVLALRSCFALLLPDQAVC